MTGRLRVALTAALAAGLMVALSSSRLRGADGKAPEGPALAEPGGDDPPAKKPPATQPAKKPPAKKRPPKTPAPKKPKSIIPEGDPWLESVAANSTFSGLVVGMPLSKDDLYGQVILVVYWDQNAKQMEQLLPTFVGLDRKYRSKGLVVIGSTKFHRDKGKALASARQFGVSFPVYGGAMVPSENLARFKKNPYCFLMDHTGKVIYENPPSGRMIGGVNAALRRRTPPLLAGKNYRKSIPIVSKIRMGRLGDALALCAKAKTGEGDAAAEAAELEERLKINGQRLVSKAGSLRKSNPRAMLTLLSQIKKQYAGSAYGTQAEEKLKELSEDKPLQNELRAEKECQPVMQALSKISRFPYDGKRSQQESWISKFGGVLKQSKARLKVLSKKYPDTKAVKEAEHMLKEAWPQKPN